MDTARLIKFANGLKRRPAARFVGMLGLASLVSVGLYLYGAWRNHDWEYGYLLWNLFLAWIPLGLAFLLVRLLKIRAWLSIWPILVSLVWLVFLPNSFYMISDYIHLQDVQRVDVLFDTVMFSSFIFTSLAMGFTSLLLVHYELDKRFKSRLAGGQVAGILLLCSYAIFLGRNLRWNTWDVILNPASILFDVSERLIHPSRHPQMFLTTISFFILLGMLYLIIRQAVKLARLSRQSDLL